MKALPEKPRASGRLGPVLLADGVVVAVWFVMRRAVLMDGGDAPDAQALLAAFVGNARDVLLYAGKMLLPAHLSVMPGLTRVDVALGAISLALLGWLLSRLAPRWRRVVIAWILLFLIPALMIPGLPAYEHRLYFPLMAVIVGISRLPAWSTTSRRAVVIASAVGVAFAAMSFVHTDVFRDRYTYWQSATTGTPYAGLAHVNLGQIAESDGNPERAAEHYRAALERGSVHAGGAQQPGRAGGAPGGCRRGEGRVPPGSGTASGERRRVFQPGPRGKVLEQDR